MAHVLWLIFLILLCVLAAILLLALLLLSVRAGIEAFGATGAASVEVRYGFLRIPIWPSPKARPEKPEKERKKKEKTSRKPSRYKYSLNREELDIGELLDLLLTLFGECADQLRISRLRVHARIGTDDAAKTGMLLGYSAALTGMIVPVLENTFGMKDYRVDVDADFEADHTEWAFSVFCSLRPVQLLFLLLRHRKEFYRLYKRLIKKEEAIIDE